MQGEEEEAASEKDCEFGRIYRIRHGHCCDCCCCCYIPPPFREECHIAFYSRNLFHFCPNPPFPATTLSLPLLPIPFSLHDDDDDDDDVGHMNGQNGCQKRGCGGGGRTGSTQCENECVARLLLILRLAAGTPPVSATLFYTSSLLFCESRERTLWGI